MHNIWEEDRRKLINFMQIEYPLNWNAENTVQWNNINITKKY